MTTKWRVIVGFAVSVAVGLPQGISGCAVGARSDPFGDDGAGMGSDAGGFTSSSGTSTNGTGTASGFTSGTSGGASGGGNGTSITGKVYDPAGRDPLYNIVVYIPKGSPTATLPQLPAGVTAASCGCSALFPPLLTYTTTGADGSFTLKDVPPGNQQLVVQAGKWRRMWTVDVQSAGSNPQPMLTLPKTVSQPGDSMPDIAVSTGVADTLECLMTRIGLPSSEFVAGASTAGHVHMFAGGLPGGTGTHTIGRPELPPATPAGGAVPTSFTDLWATQAQLMPYDITLLACEGGETYDANPPALEAYLNAGGRVFASHYHYAWFGGPIASGKWYTCVTDPITMDKCQGGWTTPAMPAEYLPPAAWGDLATWTKDPTTITTGPPIGATVDTALNGSTAPNSFAEGVALQNWLEGLGALGTGGVPAGQLALYAVDYNATVTAANTASTPWITAASNSTVQGATMYLSFDSNASGPIPVTTSSTEREGGSTTEYCGRAVYSDLHVAGNPVNTDTLPTPGGCATGELSPQEKALEFMLFDLSSCVQGVSPPMTGIVY
jgi:hypothetical protein